MERGGGGFGACGFGGDEKKKIFFSSRRSHVGTPRLGQEQGTREEMFTKRRGPLSPLAGGDSEAVDEALEGKPEESHE